MECLQTKWDTAFLGGEKKERVALIKSLIYGRVEDVLGGACYKRSTKVDLIFKLIFVTIQICCVFVKRSICFVTNEFSVSSEIHLICLPFFTNT